VRRTITLLTALALLAAGCGDDGGSLLGPTAPTTTVTTEAPSPTGAPTTEATTSSEAPAPTTTTTPPPPATTTTTTMPATTTTVPTPSGGPYLVDTTSFFPEPLPGSGRAHGSGCVVPGGSMTLPDGIWFGFAEAFAPGVITFDLACFWTGEAAIDAAAEDGEEAFDFYIRNQNPTNREVPIAGDARIWYLDGTVSLTEITAPEWPHPGSFLMCPGEYCSVWLYVNGGEVTALVEQYLP
jgi:hypothetical protein